MFRRYKKLVIYVAILIAGVTTGQSVLQSAGINGIVLYSSEQVGD